MDCIGPTGCSLLVPTLCSVSFFSPSYCYIFLFIVGVQQFVPDVLCFSLCSSYLGLIKFPKLVVCCFHKVWKVFANISSNKFCSISIWDSSTTCIILLNIVHGSLGLIFFNFLSVCLLKCVISIYYKFTDSSEI